MNKKIEVVSSGHIEITTFKTWVIEWQQENKLDGKTVYFIGDGTGLPKRFRTRKEARQYRDEKYGFIKDRPDLQNEPHGWKLPKVRRVEVEVNVKAYY